MRSCGTVKKLQRWRSSASVSRLQRQLPLPLGGPELTVAPGAAATVMRRFTVTAGGADTALTVTRPLTPESTATVGPTVPSVTETGALTVMPAAADTVRMATRQRMERTVTRQPMERMATALRLMGTAVVPTTTCTATAVMPWPTLRSPPITPLRLTRMFQRNATLLL